MVFNKLKPELDKELDIKDQEWISQHKFEDRRNRKW